jgi:hypothetical protein
MACPDTGYATLSSIAANRKLSVAFGGFARFRLLFPAGPLIVATSLGLDGQALFLDGVALLIPVWFAGEIGPRRRTEIGIAVNMARPHRGISVLARCPGTRGPDRLGVSSRPR